MTNHHCKINNQMNTMTNKIPFPKSKQTKQLTGKKNTQKTNQKSKNKTKNKNAKLCQPVFGNTTEPRHNLPTHVPAVSVHCQLLETNQTLKRTEHYEVAKESTIFVTQRQKEIYVELEIENSIETAEHLLHLFKQQQQQQMA